jgi:tetratricopeptide (TPR) repeat protein
VSDAFDDRGTEALEMALLYEGQGVWNLAQEHFEAAIASGDPETIARANFRLGHRCEHRNEWADACRHYSAAMLTGAAPWAQRAALLLGVLRMLGHDPAGARDAFQVAILSTERAVRPWALLRLGDVCLRLEDLLGAYNAYNEVLRSCSDEEAAVSWARAELREVARRLAMKYPHLRETNRATSTSG